MAAAERDAAESLTCNNCGNALTQVLRCGICKKATYCSQKCQTEDWKYNHKRVCKKPEPKKEEQPSPPVDKEEIKKQLEEMTKGKDAAYTAQVTQMMNSMMGIETPAAPQKPPEVPCQNCGKPCDKPMRCGVCKQVCYCSGQCQKDDWSSHKRRCKKPEPKAPPPGEPSPPSASSTAAPGASAPPPRPKEHETVVVDEDVGSWYKHREWKPQEEKKQFVPSKIEAAAPKEAAPGAAAAAVKSAEWNTAGTWEDKNMMPWWHKQLQGLQGISDEGTLTVDKVNSVSGEASIVYLRGIPRFMYDIKAEVTFSGLRRCKACARSAEGTRCSNCMRFLGTVAVTEMSFDAEDSEGVPQLTLEVKAQVPPGPSHVKKAGQKECEEVAGERLLPALTDFLRSRVADYKQLVDGGQRWKSQLPPKSEWTGATDCTPQPLPAEGAAAAAAAAEAAA